MLITDNAKLMHFLLTEYRKYKCGLIPSPAYYRNVYCVFTGFARRMRSVVNATTARAWFGRRTCCGKNLIPDEYNTLPISRWPFSPNSPRKTPVALPLVSKFEVWPKFYLQSCFAVCNIVLQCTAIHGRFKTYSIYDLRNKHISALLFRL